MPPDLPDFAIQRAAENNWWMHSALGKYLNRREPPGEILMHLSLAMEIRPSSARVYAELVGYYRATRSPELEVIFVIKSLYWNADHPATAGHGHLKIRRNAQSMRLLASAFQWQAGHTTRFAGTVLEVEGTDLTFATVANESNE